MQEITVRLPAEWEQQHALMLTWPHSHSHWAKILGEAENTFIAMVKHTSHYQQVIIACYDETHQKHIQKLLADSSAIHSNIHYYIARSDDSWARDHGPISVKNVSGTFLRKFIFNGWGNKYAHDYDNNIVNVLNEQHAFAPLKLEHCGWILEGGSLETDGAHTLLTTESCLLNLNRNEKLSRQEIEMHLRRDLGIKRVLWIKHSLLIGDDTDGHIDMLARFCDPKTIIHATPFPGSPDAESLEAMITELQALRTEEGNPYRLIPLPSIEPKFDDEGEQMPASYANFLIINGAVLVPVYDDANDAEALKVLGKCFPDRKIIAIPSLALIHQHGSIHCSSMNIYL